LTGSTNLSPTGSQVPATVRQLESGSNHCGSAGLLLWPARLALRLTLAGTDPAHSQIALQRLAHSVILRKICESPPKIVLILSQRVLIAIDRVPIQLYVLEPCLALEANTHCHQCRVGPTTILKQAAGSECLKLGWLRKSHWTLKKVQDERGSARLISIVRGPTSGYHVRWA